MSVVHTSSRYFHVLFYNIKTHQLHNTRDFFKLLCFFEKMVANNVINGTTCADFQRHHAEQFINLPYVPYVCSIICNTINFRIANK